jgi:hypothetical protein
MIVEIDDEFADEIIVRVLANTYVSISENLKDPEMYWHEDDLKVHKELLPAIKTVLSWYSVDADAEIKKAKKANKK